MHSIDFIRLVDKNLVDECCIKTQVFKDNNIEYILIPYLHKEVMTYYEPFADMFKVIVKLDDGLYYFAAISLGTGWSCNYNGTINYETIGLNTDCIADILNKTTKEELVDELTRQFCGVVNNIMKF